MKKEQETNPLYASIREFKLKSKIIFLNFKLVIIKNIQNYYLNYCLKEVRNF
jgi:hypothetical protein